jgi:hypothetical protein
MLVSRRGAAKEGATGGAFEVRSPLSLLDLVPLEVASGGKPSAIASVVPATIRGVGR